VTVAGWSPVAPCTDLASSALTRPIRRLGLSTLLEEIYSLQEVDVREHAKHNVEEGAQNEQILAEMCLTAGFVDSTRKHVDLKDSEVMTRNVNVVDYMKLCKTDRETFKTPVEITCGEVCSSESRSTCVRTRWLWLGELGFLRMNEFWRKEVGATPAI